MRRKHQQIEQLDGTQEFPKDPPIEKIHTCEHCGESFKDSGALLTHLDVGHTCVQCGKIFKEKLKLVSHMIQECQARQDHLWKAQEDHC